METLSRMTVIVTYSSERYVGGLSITISACFPAIVRTADFIPSVLPKGLTIAVVASGMPTLRLV